MFSVNRAVGNPADGKRSSRCAPAESSGRRGTSIPGAAHLLRHVLQRQRRELLAILGLNFRDILKSHDGTHNRAACSTRRVTLALRFGSSLAR
jgi:hypothetical protein